MSQKPFNLQDYSALPLAAALDRLAREAGVIDAAEDMRVSDWRPMPDEGRPWVYIDYRRFDAARRAAADGGELFKYLRNAPVVGEADAARKKEYWAKVDARGGAMRAFEDAVNPLIEALKAGRVVTRGFRKGSLTGENVDPARWSMGWIIARKDDTAQVEFFTVTTSEDAEVILSGLMLAVPEGTQTPRQDDARRAAGERQQPNAMGGVAEAPAKRKVRGKSKDDEPALAMMEHLILSGEAASPWAAVAMLVGQGKVKCTFAAPESVYKRLASAYNKSGRPTEKCLSHSEMSKNSEDSDAPFDT